MELRYQQLGHGITCIDTMLGRPALAACYLIEHEGMVGFVDTGTNNSVPLLIQVLQRKGIAVDKVRYIMPTHVHLDHAGGAGGLMRACPNATLLIHPRGARHMIDPARLEQGSLEVYGEEAFARMFGRVLPIEASRVQEITDGFTLDFNGRALQFLDTPGHARHHYCIFDEASRGFFSGDTCGASYRELNNGKSRFIFPPSTPTQFDPLVWIETLNRLLEFSPGRLYVTHYGMHEDAEGLLEQLKQSIHNYVDIAEEFAGIENRKVRITAALLQASSNFLLDQQCGLDAETIKSLLAQDMELNAQGLDYWLIHR